MMLGIADRFKVNNEWFVQEKGCNLCTRIWEEMSGFFEKFVYASKKKKIYNLKESF